MVNKRTSLITKVDTTTIKGISIVAVIMIHTLISLPLNLFAQPSFTYWLISVDQLFRFAVPMFVILSGYGLGMSYKHKLFTWREYLYKRLITTVPLYLIWSVYIWWVSSLISGWTVYRLGETWQHILIFGQADYHMYFIPMLMQLYVSFPFLHKLEINQLKVVTLLAFVIQIFVYSWTLQIDWNDYLQNVVGLSWLGYFAFGVLLSKTQFRLSNKKVIVLLGLSVSILLIHAQLLFYETKDLFISMRQTKWSVIPYAISLFFLLVTIARHKVIRKIFYPIGQISFLLYIIHTPILRMVLLPKITLTSWWLLLSFGLMVVISWPLMFPNRGYDFAKRLFSGKIRS